MNCNTLFLVASTRKFTQHTSRLLRQNTVATAALETKHNTPPPYHKPIPTPASRPSPSHLTAHISQPAPASATCMTAIGEVVSSSPETPRSLVAHLLGAMCGWSFYSAGSGEPSCRERHREDKAKHADKRGREFIAIFKGGKR